MLVDRRQSDNTFQMAVQFYSSHGYLAKLVAGTDPNSEGLGYWAGSFYDTANIEWGVDLYTTGEHGDYRSQRSGFQTVQLTQVITRRQLIIIVSAMSGTRRSIVIGMRRVGTMSLCFGMRRRVRIWGMRRRCSVVGKSIAIC
jgi:hypothetical protein